jgi:hypothetical protein
MATYEVHITTQFSPAGERAVPVIVDARNAKDAVSQVRKLNQREGWTDKYNHGRVSYRAVPA